MAYNGNSMSINATEAYENGRKPYSRITKDDILKHGVSESINFFKWYVKKICKPCEWHHTSPEFNETLFYNIAECSKKFKSADLSMLKAKYHQELDEKKAQRNISNEYYYALIEYSHRTMSGSRIYHKAYAIIFRDFAYIKPDSKKSIKGKHFCIIKEFSERPEEMSEEAANVIMEELRVKSTKIKLRTNDE